MRAVTFGTTFVSISILALFLAAPIIATAQDATPSPTPSGPNTVFMDMLSIAPDVLDGSEATESDIAQFADVALQLQATGVSVPTSVDDPAMHLWVRAIRWMVLPQDLASRVFDPTWREVFGFDVLQVDQSLVAGEPPNVITILRGRFEQAEVIGALANSGYQEVDVDGLTIYSLSEDASVDLKNPVSQLALARMNNVVFLPDGTLVAAATLDLIRQVIAVSQGNANSLADRLDVSTIVNAMPRQLASAILVRGGVLQLGGMVIDFSASPGQTQELLSQIDQLGEMPPITMALFGISPGGPLPEPLAEGTPEATPVIESIEPAVYEIGLLTLAPGLARDAEEIVVARVG